MTIGARNSILSEDSNSLSISRLIFFIFHFARLVCVLYLQKIRKNELVSSQNELDKVENVLLIELADWVAAQFPQ